MIVRIAVSLLLIAVCTLAVAQDKPAVPRRNLVNFFNKCRAGGPVTVAYIGGSITEANGWRPMTTNWLRQQFHGVEIKEVQGAIGGTGSLLGVFRMGKHVLEASPDLIFVEFAVNDSGMPDDSVKATMEGIVRQAWSGAKEPDLVFTYTTAGDFHTPTARHQAVADAYGIPTVDFQAPTKMICDAGYIDWDILAADRVHPGDWGHGIYAATLATFLRKQMALKDPVGPPGTLPPAVFSDKYTTARLQAVTPKNLPEGWEKLPAAGWFRDGSIMCREVGRTISFPFTGTTVGLYYEIRQDAGIVACEVDGQPVAEVDTSWGPIYKFNRFNATIVADDLPKGPHTLTLRMLDKHQELSHGHELHLGYLMVAG